MAEIRRGQLAYAHERCFLDRIATHIIAIEGDSKVNFFDGPRGWLGRGARRGLPCPANPRRQHRWAAPIASPTRGQSSRHFSEYEGWRKQQLADAALRPDSAICLKLTR
jgi:ATPase subunit of ABC transporter with duplicated ATPase domains